MAWQAPDVLLAALSDIHGNLPALEAVLAELERETVDELVCLGDVALGPHPSKTVARVRGLGCPVVMGNWDAWVLEGFQQRTKTHGSGSSSRANGGLGSSRRRTARSYAHSFRGPNSG